MSNYLPRNKNGQPDNLRGILAATTAALNPGAGLAVATIESPAFGKSLMQTGIDVSNAAATTAKFLDSSTRTQALKDAFMRPTHDLRYPSAGAIENKSAIYQGFQSEPQAMLPGNSATTKAIGYDPAIVPEFNPRPETLLPAPGQATQMPTLPPSAYNAEAFVKKSYMDLAHINKALEYQRSLLKSFTERNPLATPGQNREMRERAFHIVNLQSKKYALELEIAQAKMNAKIK